MDKKKIGEGLAGALRKAADTAKVAKITVQELAADAKQEIADKTKQKSASTKRTASQNDNKVSATEDNTATEIKGISVKNALKIIYYLMAVDGTVFHSEEEKFDAIGAELDPEFADNKASIISGCQAQLGKIIDSEDYYDVLQDGVEAAISDTQETSESIITPKLLVWNLLTVAYSDENYDETERKLIKYVVRKLNIDKAVFLEMESSMLTMLDIEKELAWIKTTDRPYLTIEARVNELEKRKNVVFDSVKDLITL